MRWSEKQGSARRRVSAVLAGTLALGTMAAQAATEEEMERAKKWLDEFQPSTLSREQQLKELEWFIDAAKPFRGMDIQVVSETITTHEYEANVLA
jgi:glycerol transport system substrate-binding protein